MNEMGHDVGTRCNVFLRRFNPCARMREILYRIGLSGRSTIMEMSINGVREHTLPDPRLAHNDHVTIHDSSITANQSKE